MKNVLTLATLFGLNVVLAMAVSPRTAAAADSVCNDCYEFYAVADCHVAPQYFIVHAFSSDGDGMCDNGARVAKFDAEHAIPQYYDCWYHNKCGD